MQLSTRGRYAVMALLDLVDIQNTRKKDMPVKLSEIAERQAISLSYLEQLFSQLRKGGMVKSIRGPGGGYVLANEPTQTWLSDIIRSVDEPVDMTRCGVEDHGGNGCVKGARCNAHHLWVALGDCVEAFLNKVSLQMVLENDLASDFTGLSVGKFDACLTTKLDKLEGKKVNVCISG